MEELEYEVSKCCLHPLIKNDNAAAACYDRILMYIASLASRKMGMPVRVCKVNGMNLEQAQYHIKTSLGTSVTFLGHTEEDPWHGSGQGAGNLPALWLFISSTLFDYFEPYATGATFASPDGTKQVKLFMTGFVDDTNSRTNCFLTNTIPSVQALVDKATKDAPWWSDLLWSSGGKLEASKCSFHHLRYEFKSSGEPRLVSGTDFTPTIKVKSTDGIVTPIRPVDNYNDHKSLGCFKGPAGTLTAQKAALIKKCNHYTRVLKGSPLNRREANMFYCSIFLSSVGYCLETTFFKDVDLDTIESAPRRAALQKRGYRANTAKVICYGSWKLGGIEMFRLANKQGIGVIQQFLKHWRTRCTDIGDLSEVTYAWLQFHAGNGRPILEDLEIDCHLPVGLFQCMRRFLHSVGGTIEVHNARIPPLQREHDSYIMDWVGWYGNFSEADLKRINYVRLYFQVVTVADITTACGTYIREEFWHGFSSPLRPHTTYFKMFQDRPKDPRTWWLWRKALSLFAPNLTLDVPLGRWLVSADKLRMRHRFFYKVDANVVYQQVDNEESEFWMFQHPVPNKDRTVHCWEFGDETYLDASILHNSVPLDPYFPRSCTSVQPDSGKRRVLDLTLFNQRETVVIGSGFTAGIPARPLPPTPTTFEDFLYIYI